MVSVEYFSKEKIMENVECVVLHVCWNIHLSEQESEKNENHPIEQWHFGDSITRMQNSFFFLAASSASYDFDFSSPLNTYINGYLYLNQNATSKIYFRSHDFYANGALIWINTHMPYAYLKTCTHQNQRKTTKNNNFSNRYLCFIIIRVMLAFWVVFCCSAAVASAMPFAMFGRAHITFFEGNFCSSPFFPQPLLSEFSSLYSLRWFFWFHFIEIHLFICFVRLFIAASIFVVIISFEHSNETWIPQIHVNTLFFSFSSIQCITFIIFVNIDLLLRWNGIQLSKRNNCDAVKIRLNNPFHAVRNIYSFHSLLGCINWFSHDKWRGSACFLLISNRICGWKNIFRFFTHQNALDWTLRKHARWRKNKRAQQI